jgi:hypothetical protein
MRLTQENSQQLKTMGKNFTYLRSTKNWSIKELSELSEISEKALLDIEDGQEFDTPYLFKLCAIYDIKPHEIFSPLKNSPAIF